MENWRSIRNLLIACLIGLITGVISSAFISCIKWVTAGIVVNQIPVWILPLISGVLLLFIEKYLLHNDIDFGVHEVKRELFLIERQIMTPKEVTYKIFATLVSILGGFSVGRFGPLVFIGGAAGSLLSYRFKFEKEDVKIFIGCGIAGSLASIFNAPVFAIVFVLEIFMDAIVFNRLGPIMVSVLTALEVNRWISGDFKYSIIDILHVDYSDDLIYMAIWVGLITGVFSFGYNVLLHQSKKFYRNHNKFYFPLIGAVGISFVLYFWPANNEIYYNVYNVSNMVMFSTGALAFLLILKYVTTALSFSMGAIGGTFASAIYMGFILGVISIKLFGLSSGIVILFMTGMFSGYINAPLAATLFFTSFEGANIFIVPLFIVAVVSSTLNGILKSSSKSKIKL